MADTGWVSPGTIVSDDSYGSTAWSNPDNAKTSNNTYATNSGNTENSNYLKATNFGFSIPSGKTIDGILVDFERKASSAWGVSGLGERVRIVKSDGTIGSTDRGDASYWSTTEAYVEYGGESDLWGETWSSSDINDSDFGVVLNTVIESYSTASVDHIRIKVYYSTGPDVTVTTNVQSASFSLPSPVIAGVSNINLTAGVQVASFSLPTPSISGGSSVVVSNQTSSFFYIKSNNHINWKHYGSGKCSRSHFFSSRSSY